MAVLSTVILRMITGATERTFADTAGSKTNVAGADNKIMVPGLVKKLY